MSETRPTSSGFTVTWDHAWLYLWCLACCDKDGWDEEPAWYDAGNPTDIAGILIAIGEHLHEHHPEGLEP
jgi:hypothetical protein